MKRLALILAGGALWLFLATPIFADGGPHISAVNNGSLGLTSDNCAGCHRAHTAQGADLLKVDQGALCLSCHNGNGSTVDVVDGLQYVPDNGTAPNNPTHTGNTVLGALRGGGFTYALIQANNPSRKNYLSQTQSLAFSGFNKGDTFRLTFINGNGTATTSDDASFQTGDILFGATNPTAGASAGATTISLATQAGFKVGNTFSISGDVYTISALGTADSTTGVGTVTFSPGLTGAITTSTVVINASGALDNYMKTTAGEVQRGLRGLPAAQSQTTLPVMTPAQPTKYNFSASWSSPTAVAPSTPAGTSTVNVSLSQTLTFVPVAHPLMTVQAISGGGSITVSQDSSQVALRALPRVGVINASAKEPVTSSHLRGPDKVWGNGAVAAGTGVALLGGDELECASCHNPHGSGTYRILRTDPGEDWISEHTPTFTNGNAVAVPDILKRLDGTTLDPTTMVRNYTVLPATTAAEVAANSWTATQGDYVRRNQPFWNYSLSADFDTNGWAQDATKPNVTEWCIACHTRYNGKTTYDPVTYAGSPSSLVSPDTSDTHFTFKHGTERVGCLMCHVSHGSNAEMIGSDSANYTNPDDTAQLVYRLATSPSTFSRTGTVQLTVPSGTAGVDYRIEGDSRLLKADNRGTCQLCHDPTGTSTGGTTTGLTPAPLVP